jgi:hypothetical protein
VDRNIDPYLEAAKDLEKIAKASLKEGLAGKFVTQNNDARSLQPVTVL